MRRAVVGAAREISHESTPSPKLWSLARAKTCFGLDIIDTEEAAGELGDADAVKRGTSGCGKVIACPLAFCFRATVSPRLSINISRYSTLCN